MPRPIEALIHTDALAHNLDRARAAVPRARVWAVVKANAYGHGVARAFEGLRGCDGFALLDLHEAEQLRDLGWRGPILLLEGTFSARDLDDCARLDLWHTVHCDDQIDWLSAHPAHAAHRVYLKVNSGMNRLGFTPAQLPTAWARLAALPQVAGVSLMTHFSDADGLGARSDGIQSQLKTFTESTRELPGERSLCNSAALLRHGADRAVQGDWVRAGILLYGGAPDHPEHDGAHWGLRPAMSLHAELIAVQSLRPGDSVGYGSHFVATEPMRVGVVACGYADGYPRHAPSGTPVLVDGVRTQLVGRVSMDMLAVDLRPVPHAMRGSKATLWGQGPRGSVLPIDEVAHAAGTIGYELMCALAARVPVRTVANWCSHA